MLLSGRQLSGEYPKVGFTQVSTCFGCFIELRQNTHVCHWFQSKMLFEYDKITSYSQFPPFCSSDNLPNFLISRRWEGSTNKFSHFFSMNFQSLIIIWQLRTSKS